LQNLSATDQPQAIDSLDYQAIDSIACDPRFLILKRERRRFIVSTASFAIVFNLLQPILSVYTKILDGRAVGPMTWGWVYAFAQMLVPLILLQLYVYKSRKFDRQAERLRSCTRSLER
jgi:uncharacterized membrane protein (DUF485 family)